MTTTISIHGSHDPTFSASIDPISDSLQIEVVDSTGRVVLELYEDARRRFVECVEAAGPVVRICE